MRNPDWKFGLPVVRDTSFPATGWPCLARGLDMTAIVLRGPLPPSLKLPERVPLTLGNGGPEIGYADNCRLVNGDLWADLHYAEAPHTGS